MQTSTPLLPEHASDPSRWDQALYAFLAEKERRSGSLRTVQGYSRMLADFFGRAGKPPDRVVSSDVLTWAHGVGLSGRRPSSITIGARIACLSSFYRFLIRHGLVAGNPCDALERPKLVPGAPRGLDAEQVRRLLTVIPDDVPGRRDRAIVLTLVLTGRRKSEVLNLKAGDIAVEGEVAFYRYTGKGGKNGRRELPRPAYEAILETLADTAKSLETMRPGESLWQAVAPPTGVSGPVFYGRFRRYLRHAGLPLSGIHVLRHSAAKLRRDAGESIENVSQFLDHSSLAVTTTYLRRLEGQRDEGWSAVAEAIGA
jgi:site-specific recombinase XerD